MSRDRGSVRDCPAPLVLVALVFWPGTGKSESEESLGTRPALRVGVLFNERGTLGEFGRAGRAAAALAVEHVNAAGGVGGRPVELVFADAGVDPEATVDAASRLAEASGVHAFIGPFGSAAALAVARQVSGPRRLPTITPTASSPELSRVADDGYLFRSAVSDAAQAPVLAGLARDEGYEHVAVLYLDDAYGQGLHRAFAAAWQGKISAEAIEPGQASYAEALRRVAAGGAEVLIAMSYEAEAGVYLTEAKRLGLFDRFLLVDGTLSQDFVALVGAEMLEGVKGTSSVSDIGPIGTDPAGGEEDFRVLYRAATGEEPTKGIEANAYDITVCLALATEHAGSEDGAAIRDAIHQVCSGPGKTYGAGPAGVAAALEAIRKGRPVNFDGAASKLTFDANGDLADGEVAVWQYQAGVLTEIRRERFGVPIAVRAE